MLIQGFNVKMIRAGRQGITPEVGYPVLGMTGSLNDTAFFVPDDNGKITFIKLSDAHFAGIEDKNITDVSNVQLQVIAERLEALQSKVNSLQGQISALKGKKGE